MQVSVFDLHLHSPFSFATSSKMTLENITEEAKRKKIDYIAISDILHPVWIKDNRRKLKLVSDGIYEYNDIKVLLVGEISLIYREYDKTRKIHILLGVSDFDKLERLIDRFSIYGKLGINGRPILKLSIKKFMEIVLSEEENPLIIPAHIWTPWYGILGSKSGYDSIKEAFGEFTTSITALETGLSSDIDMNSRVSEVASYPLVSFSDAHSLNSIGRELTLLKETPRDFYHFLSLIKNRKIITGEVYPQHGKYFLSGHRKCNYIAGEESIEILCPVCGAPLTEGVSYRVTMLSDREKVHIQDFFYMVDLKEISRNRKVRKKLLKFAPWEIFFGMTEHELLKYFDDVVVSNINRIRKGEVKWKPGYDGIYGKMEDL